MTPNSIIERFGADTARLFILFAAPPEKQLEWSDAGVEGASRFLNRVWRLVNQVTAPTPSPGQRTGEGRDEGTFSSALTPPTLSHLTAGEGGGLTEPIKELLRKQHWAINKVTKDVGIEIQINTAISAVMELVNVLYQYPALGDAYSVKAVSTVIQLLSPIAPHLMEELWQLMGHSGLASESSWPTADPQWLIAESVEVVIQINGKLKVRLDIAPGTPKDTLEKTALADPKVQAALAGRTVVKVIVVPDKLVNIVVK